MAMYTDSRPAGAAMLPPGAVGRFLDVATSAQPAASLLHALFDGAPTVHRAPVDLTGWRTLLVRDHAPSSQFDAIVQLIRAGEAVPDGVVCVARTGSGMHGFRGRPWAALAGNIHLTVHLAPGRPIERFESAFTALAAVAAAEAADTVPGLHGRARIKWVNDVLVEGAKVGGVLAFTQTRDRVVTSAVLGIGLNVEATPAVERSPVVPAASSLRDAARTAAGSGDDGGAAGDIRVDDVRVGDVLPALLDALRRNYAVLLADGPAPLLDAYRARSAVLGQVVTIVADDAAGLDILATGRLAAIGDSLELYIEGVAEPVTRGRLVLGTLQPTDFGPRARS